MEKLQTIKRREEINLVSLFYYCLYQWKKMLCIGMVLAILMCGYKTYNYYSVKNSDGKTGYDLAMEKYDIAKGQYNHSVEAYNLSLQSMDTAIDSLMMEIDNAEKYCEESPIMQLDPLAYYRASLRLYIDTDYKIMPDMTYQNVNKTPAVMSSFVAELSTPSFIDELGAASGFDSMYVDDIYTIKSSDNCFVYISYIGPSEEFVVAGINAIKAKIADSTKEIGEILGDFSTILTDYGTTSVSSQEILTYQESKKDEVISKKTNLVKLKDDLAKVVEPAEFSEGRPSVIKTAVKNGLVGGIIGVFLIVAYTIVSVLIGGRMISYQDVTKAFEVRTLGRYAGKECKGLTKLIRKWEGKSDIALLDRDLKLIAHNIANNSKDFQGKLLLTGSEGFASAEKLIKEISAVMSEVQIVCGHSMLTDVDTLAVINDCDAVILIEKCGVSKYANIERELQTLLDLGKKVIGIVVEE